MALIEMGKKYRTRDGIDVEIIQILAAPLMANGATVIGVVDGDSVLPWQPHGSFYSDGREAGLDLIEVVEPLEPQWLWLNVYPNGSAASHQSRERADKFAAVDRIACVPVPYMPGEGL
jgi:hypothetical protein